MACCTDTHQKFWVAGCSTAMLLIALILGLLWPTITYRYLLYPQLVLKEGSVNYENWIETPIPIYFEVFFFNWTNHEDVHNLTTKPKFTEMGPYAFSEKHIRTNLTWHDNGTITFYQKRIWEFVEERSVGTLDDNVTNLNVIAATVGYSARYYSNVIKLLVSIMMGSGRAPLVVTKTVRELMFEGYDDGLLKLVRENNNPDLPKPPFDKFGWFVDRNDSETYDGNFTMFTGETDITKLGILQLWNDKSKTNLFRGACDNVVGTTGELLPPIKDGQKPPLQVFATDICRTVTIKYDSDYEALGIKGYKWVGDDSVFDNGVKYPEMSCYCSAQEESCPDLLPGVFNASSCKFGSPAFASYPHFYLAHEHYRNAVEGMNPSKEEHEFQIAANPRTGIPLKIKAQMQINILMKSYPWSSIKDVPETMMPMFWFRQSAELTPELASQAKIAVMLPDIGVWAAYGFAGIGALLFLFGIYSAIYRWRSTAEDEELLS